MELPCESPQGDPNLTERIVRLEEQVTQLLKQATLHEKVHTDRTLDDSDLNQITSETRKAY